MQSVRAAVLLLFAVVALSEAFDEKQKAAYRKHTTMLNQFPCRTPQPRAIESKELVSKDLYGEGTIIPASTVLYRCQGTGCCKSNGMRCVPSAEEEVFVTFAISHRTLQYQEVKLVNHTQCACSDAYKDFYRIQN